MMESEKAMSADRNEPDYAAIGREFVREEREMMQKRAELERHGGGLPGSMAGRLGSAAAVDSVPSLTTVEGRLPALFEAIGDLESAVAQLNGYPPSSDPDATPVPGDRFERLASFLGDMTSRINGAARQIRSRA